MKQDATTHYHKKPIRVEAFQWTGDLNQTEDPPWICEALREGSVWIESKEDMPGILMYIGTLEGTMTANVGDWIMRGVEGEIYPCKASIFEATYSSCKTSHHEETRRDVLLDAAHDALLRNIPCHVFTTAAADAYHQAERMWK